MSYENSYKKIVFHLLTNQFNLLTSLNSEQISIRISYCNQGLKSGDNRKSLTESAHVAKTFDFPQVITGRGNNNGSTPSPTLGSRSGRPSENMAHGAVVSIYLSNGDFYVYKDFKTR